MRRPKRKPARLDQVAAVKTWAGTRSKDRRDRLTPAEKFVAAVWHTAAAGGMAVSINLGSRREGTLLGHRNPGRLLAQNLNRELNRAGFGNLPHAFVFERAGHHADGRLHLHGVMDTAGLTGDQRHALELALRRAASISSGAIGGERQVDRRPIHDPAGWADYLLKHATRTARELEIEHPFIVNRPMQQQAKRYFEGLREEVLGRLDQASHRAGQRPAIHRKARDSCHEPFTQRADFAIDTMSGERDATSVGGLCYGRVRRPNRVRAVARSVRLGTLNRAAVKAFGQAAPRPPLRQLAQALAGLAVAAGGRALARRRSGENSC